MDYSIYSWRGISHSGARDDIPCSEDEYHPFRNACHAEFAAQFPVVHEAFFPNAKGRSNYRACVDEVAFKGLIAVLYKLEANNGVVHLVRYDGLRCQVHPA